MTKTEVERLWMRYEDACAVDVRLWRKADAAERANFHHPSLKNKRLADRTLLNARSHYEQVTNPLRNKWLAARKELP